MIARFVNKIRLTENVWSYYFEPEKPLDYIAGQFIELTLEHQSADSRGQRRWFTLSSCPSEPLLCITTRHSPKPSTFKRVLNNLQTGQTAVISDAMGDFVLPRQNTIPLLFVAFGIGITPIRSMINELQHQKQSRDSTLIYVTKDQHTAIFGDYLASQVPTTFYDRSIEQHQIIDLVIADLKGGHELPRIYLSGPEHTIEAMYASLIENNIPEYKIVTDYFHGYSTIDTNH